MTTTVERRRAERRIAPFNLATAQEWARMHRTEPVRTSGLKITCLGLLAVHTFLAVAFAAGAPLRFSTSSFNTAKQAFSLHEWAVVFAIAAITLIASWPFRRLLILQLFCGMFLYLFWASCFAWSIHASPSAGLTGPILWGFCAVVQLGCASALIPPRLRR